MRINLNSPDGNTMAILGKVYKLLVPEYGEDFTIEYISNMFTKDYEEILEKLQEDWKNFKPAVGEDLEFYKSKEYEMEV